MMGKRVSPKAIVTIILLAGLMTILGGFSGGAVIRTDQDLSDSTASFLGEAIREYAGESISAAGDVNGDGYDDFLIGTYRNTEAGEDWSQVYLIFGNASGWDMDINLSKADASFWVNDAPGFPTVQVAGAGDVNRDGFDDLLFGNVYDSDAGIRAGKAYLVLGKATGWTMDTNLSMADASFLGENRGDWVGRSVAGAGDVNGDGFDDILIGAPYSDLEVEGRTGKTYLIFGKSSGWALDTNISTADASFHGEQVEDAFGTDADIVGDVNRDGFDDILIGAPFNDETNRNAGQTYLVFGKASGWTRYANISTADASFLGEVIIDLSGYHVAGAGDVNADGYNDFLIGAFYNDAGGPSAGQAYLILGKGSGWGMDTQLSNVDASFIGESRDDFVGSDVAAAGDVNKDGYDDFIIGASGNDHGEIDGGQTYLILGKETDWEMDTYLWYADASFWGENMNDHSGGSISCAGDVNGDGYDDILIAASYNSENGNRSGQVYLIMFDFLPPNITKDSTPSIATTGDEFTFNLSVYDNVGIEKVSIEFWYEGPQGHDNLTADRVSGDRQSGTWGLNVTVPSDSTGALHYIVHILDTSDHLFSSSEKEIMVLDNDPPVFSDDESRLDTTSGFLVRYSINASDNIGLSDVKVEYWYGTEGIRTNVSMRHLSGDIWILGISAPSYRIETLHYFFFAEDISNNTAITQTKDINIIDDQEPIFENDITPNTGYTGDPFEFSVTVFDTIGLDKVTVDYWYSDDGVHNNVSLGHISGNTWNHTIIVPWDSLETLHYFFHAKDFWNNTAVSPTRDIVILDNDKPLFVSGVTHTIGYTGDPLEFELTVTDNIGVRSVSLGYWGNQSKEISYLDMVKGPFDTWSIVFFLPSDSLEDLLIRYRAIDLASNEAFALGRTITVMDNDPPILDPDLTPSTVVKGLTLTLIIGVDDNIEISEVHLEYWFGEEAHQDLTVSHDGPYEFSIEVPRHQSDDLHYIFSAVDSTGNWNSTNEALRTPINQPPEVRDIPVWYITEEQQGELNITRYIHDMNDGVPSLSLHCDADEITVDGQTLMAFYQAYVPEHGIELIVNDGEDVVKTTILIHVVNVNDRPLITTLLPENGTEFYKGDNIVFEVGVEDEDDDELTITWKRGETVLGIGSRFRHSEFPNGEHIVTVEIFDGTVTTEESITVYVWEVDSRSSNLPLIIAILILAVVIIVLMYRMGTVRRVG
jgi:hypothetical protein